jgi:hypothetical protein
LRDAVLAANATPGSDTINFDPALTTVTLENEIRIAGVGGALTINGNRAKTFTIDGGPDINRIFFLNTGDVTITDVTLTGGEGGKWLAPKKTDAPDGSTTGIRSGREDCLKTWILSDKEKILGGNMNARDNEIYKTRHLTKPIGQEVFPERLWFLKTLIVCVALLAVPASLRAQGTGALKVTSFPSGAKVSIDGVDTGKVTPMSVSLSLGDHLVLVSIPSAGWNPDSRTVTIVSGNNDLSVTLLPIVTNGTNGIDGTSVTVVGTFSGNQNGCPNGGTILRTANGNAYICDGANGTNGTRAAGPCFDNLNRYVDCGNGTVTDTVTGLIWKQPNCLLSANWTAANEAAARLKNGDCALTDGSSPGDWRLPTKAEWEATVARAVALGCTGDSAPALTNTAGIACYGTGSSASFPGVGSKDNYWSSTPFETTPSGAWVSLLFNGKVLFDNKVVTYGVWPVRGGTR